MSDSSATTTKTTVTPYLTIKGAGEAVDFYVRAFGAVEVLRMTDPESGMVLHAEIKLGDDLVYISEECPTYGNLSPTSLGGTPSAVHVNLPNVDEVFQRAVEAGARPLSPPADQFWGDRYARIEDPFGHRWLLATTIETLTPEQMQARMVEAMATMPDCS